MDVVDEVVSKNVDGGAQVVDTERMQKGGHDDEEKGLLLSLIGERISTERVSKCGPSVITSSPISNIELEDHEKNEILLFSTPDTSYNFIFVSISLILIVVPRT